MSQVESAVAGRVLSESSPLVAAKVYAYQLSDSSFERVLTDERGQFLFSQLPAGLYKIIAHKPGFVPAVIMLTRTAADAYQFVEVQLAEESLRKATEGGDFWTLRSQVPSDILREIAIAELEHVARSMDSPVVGARLLQAEMVATTGVDEISSVGSAQRTGGRLSLEGQLGDLQMEILGDFQQLAAGRLTGPSSILRDGQTSSLSVRLESSQSTQVEVSSLSNRLRPQDQGDFQPVDFEYHQVSVDQPLGENSHSRFSAQYTRQSHFHRHGWTEPLLIPESSASWRVEGSFSTQLSDRTSLETGLRFRERDWLGASPNLLDAQPVQDRMDLFSRASFEVEPRVVVEYGLYSTLRDGSISLTPRGSLVVQLGSEWQATTTVSHKVSGEDTVDRLDFAPSFYDKSSPCEQGEAYCYQLVMARHNDEDEVLSFGAIHREFAETLRFYFDDDMFNRLESLYVVPGDRLPELQFSLSRRLSPRVLARFESNLGSGGGGIFYATDNGSYENQIRYLVTSMDTRFQGSSTGLFIAFHHLEQQLNPTAAVGRGEAPEELQLERLQLMLTQDLGILLNLASDWAVQLNMELSRGSSPFDGVQDRDSDLRKRILGGIAVRF